MANLFFKDRSQIYNIYLGKETYEQMLGYCSKANPYETGGVLIGNYSHDQTIADILQITPPPKDSKHSKHNFANFNIFNTIRFYVEILGYRSQQCHIPLFAHKSSSAAPLKSDK